MSAVGEHHHLVVERRKKMDKKLKVGDRVILLGDEFEKYDPEEDDTCRGVIVSLCLDDDDVSVKWDDGWRNPNPETVALSDLIAEKEGDKQLNALEKEYRVWAKEVEVKCKEAGKLIKEAHKIAKKHGKDLSEMSDVNGSIEGAMAASGWSTSSWGC
jgi:hypothetical protein